MLFSSRWLRSLHCTRGVALTLQTAVHVFRLCGYAVISADALRSTTSTLSVLSGHSICSHHILPYSLFLSSHDWTALWGQARSLTLAQASTPISSTTGAPQLPLKLIFSSHTSGWSLNASTQTVQPSPTLPQDACSCRLTQCHYHRRLHTTLNFRFSPEMLLQRPLTPHGPSICTWRCQWRPSSPTQGDRHYQQSRVTAHHLRLRDLRNRHSWKFHTTPFEKQRPRVYLRPVASVLPRRVFSLHLNFRPPCS